MKQINKIWKSNIEHLFPRRVATDDQELVHFFAFNKHMLKELHEGNAINRDNLIPAKWAPWVSRSCRQL